VNLVHNDDGALCGHRSGGDALSGATLDGERVPVTLIGEKRGAALVVEGEELKL
jgi:hypothetical protein